MSVDRPGSATFSRRGMRAAATLAVCLSVALSGYTAPRASAMNTVAIPRDTVILLDVTASMRGLGTDTKARDIWDLVVQKVIEQINDLPDGTTLAIVPFDAGPRLPMVWPQAPSRTTDQLQFATLDTSTRAEAVAHIRRLVPDGQNTWICDTLEYGLVQLKVWRDQQQSNQRIQAVYLYTDGLDNGRCGTNFVPELVSTFKGAAQDFPYLYGVYIDLNGHLTPEEIAAMSGQPGLIYGAGLPDFVDLDPGPINLGAQPSMTTGVDVTLHFNGVLPARSLTAAVAVLPASLGLTATPSTVTLASEVTVHLASTAPMSPGTYAIAIRLSPANGNFLFANSSTDVFFDVPAAATQAPASAAQVAPTTTPVPTATPAPTSAPTPAGSANSDPTLPLGLLGLAVLVGLLAFVSWRTPRFSKDAALEVAGEPHMLRETAGFAFYRPQQVVVSGPDSSFGLEGGESGASSKLIATRGGSSMAILDPAGTAVTVNGSPVSDSQPISYGAHLAGDGWKARYVQVMPVPDELLEEGAE